MTKQTGAAQFVTPGTGVVLSDGAQLEVMVETLKRWCSHPDELHRAGREARAAVMKWTFADMGAHYVRLIEEMSGFTKS